MHIKNQVGEPVVVHGQEVLKVVDAPAPPVFHVARVQPSDADAHIDRGDKLLPRQRGRGGRLYPSLEIRLAHGTEHNTGAARDRSIAAKLIRSCSRRTAGANSAVTRAR